MGIKGGFILTIDSIETQERIEPNDQTNFTIVYWFGLLSNESNQRIKQIESIKQTNQTNPINRKKTLEMNQNELKINQIFKSIIDV